MVADPLKELTHPPILDFDDVSDERSENILVPTFPSKRVSEIWRSDAYS